MHSLLARFRHRPLLNVGFASCLAITLVACATSAQTPKGTGQPPSLSDCSVFPANNVWNTPIGALPVHRLSGDYVATIGAERNVHPDFGSGLWDGGTIGIPYTTVEAGQLRVAISFDYHSESDPGPYPIPANAPVEGAPPGGVKDGGDRHVLVVDTSDCTLYELFAAELQSDGTWKAGSGAIFDLNSNELRPDGWTSADAAGLPILPGLVRYDEVAAGAINHALRFTAPQTQRAYVWPARHYASSRTEASYPPLGMRFRLRADFDASGMSPETQVIVTALKRYGMFLADNGSSWYLSGAPDERWDNSVLRELRQIVGADFEAVDTSGLMIDKNSAEAKSEYLVGLLKDS